MRLLIAAILAVSAVLLPAQAQASARPDYMFDRHNANPFQYVPAHVRISHRRHVKVAHRRVKHHASSHGRSARIVPHTRGCPRTAFCGCSASVEVFGRNIRELWLASSWFKFPRAAAAPGMVAVRRHHVFVIRKVLGNGLVLAFDANSGNHKTRIWVRSLAGFTVVNPRRSRA